jgi:Polyketide cyclase / dehydrase and lipid transport
MAFGNESIEVIDPDEQETLMARGVIDADIEQVWATVSDYAGLMRWHPQLSACETVGEGVGAIRTAQFSDRWAAERLDILDAAQHTLLYVVTESDEDEIVGLACQISLRPDGDQTILTWSARATSPERTSAIRPRLQAYYATRIQHLRDALKATAR